MRVFHRSVFRIVLSVARLFALKLFYLRSLTTHGVAQVEADVSFFILSKGRVELGHRVFLGRGVEIQARSAELAIGDRTAINRHSRVIAFKGIRIGERCAIGQFVTILDHDHALGNDGHMQGYVSAEIQIGNDVWIGDKATILKGVSIGDRARIGAGAVVNRDVPAGCLAVGVPCRIVRPKNQKEPA